MFIFNIRKLLAMRGISEPVAFFQKYGFSRSAAGRISQGKSRYFTLKKLEKLCQAFQCTPNDLLEWVPEGEGALEKPANRKLRTLMAQKDSFHLYDVGKDVPLDKLEDLEKVIREFKASLG